MRNRVGGMRGRETIFKLSGNRKRDGRREREKKTERENRNRVRERGGEEEREMVLDLTRQYEIEDKL